MTGMIEPSREGTSFEHQGSKINKLKKKSHSLAKHIISQTANETPACVILSRVVHPPKQPKTIPPFTNDLTEYFPQDKVGGIAWQDHF